MKLKAIWHLLKETFSEFNKDEPFRLSAVVAYYAILSLPAMLVIIFNLAGIFYGPSAVEGKISQQITEMMGSEAADQIETMLVKAYEHKDNKWATIIGVATLLFGATTMFYHLQKSINIIWGVKADPKKGWLKYIIDRLISLGLIFVIGALLILFLISSALLSALSDWLLLKVPNYLIILFHIGNFLISVGIITLLFAIIFKFMPDVDITWHTVWVGALFTSVLFVIGKTLLGFYLGYSNPASTYGAAGAVVLILLWVSYSCLIFFFGAEFTQVYARTHHEKIKPSSHAVRTASYNEWLEKRQAEKLHKQEQAQDIK